MNYRLPCWYRLIDLINSNLEHFHLWQHWHVWYDAAAAAFTTTTTIVPKPPDLFIAAISIVSKEWLYRITKKVGERLNSQVVIANAWHHRSDAYSSILALFSIAMAKIEIYDRLNVVANFVLVDIRCLENTCKL